jgi:hypothetical protein
MTGSDDELWSEHAHGAAERLRERQLELLKTRRYSYGDRKSASRNAKPTESTSLRPSRASWSGLASLKSLFGRRRA